MLLRKTVELIFESIGSQNQALITHRKHRTLLADRSMTRNRTGT